MPKVVFLNTGGDVIDEVEAASGVSIMQVAIENGIDGILGECGGTCSCATCHCYVGDVWRDKLTGLGEMERELLTCVYEPDERSRLACQVFLTEEVDGIEVTVPEKQF